MDCRETVVHIHEYLDGDLDEWAGQRLREHLSTCPDCRKHLSELQRAVAFVQSASFVHVPADFTIKVLAKLPPQTSSKRLSNWLRHHPFFAAAAVFLVLMAGSVSATWFDRDNTLQVSSSNLDKLKIDQSKNTVVVPVGTKINGNLVVRNGSVIVEGEVTGNVVAIEGKVFLASTAQVAGNTEEIEAIFDWIWYELKNIGNDLLPATP